MKSKLNLLLSHRKYWFVPFIGVLFLCWSCDKSEDFEVKVFDPEKPVVIESFLPDSGGVGTQLVILGENFGEDKSIVKVIVNEREATVIGITDTRIYAVVPARAGTGKVTVILKDEFSSESKNDFLYKLSQNVSTLSGSTDETGHGGMVDGKLNVASFIYPYLLEIDDENNLFVVQRIGERTPSTGNGSQAFRMVAIDEDMVTTRFKASGSTSNVRAIAFNPGQDTLWCINDTWDNPGVGLFTLTKEQGWYDVQAQHSNTTLNGLAINPVDSSIVYSHYQKSILYYYDPKTDTKKQLLSLGENWVVYLCFSPDGKYLYMSVPIGQYQPERGRLFRAEWDSETKSLVNSELISIDYLSFPEQITCDEQGNLYVCDAGNHTIEMWNPKTKTFTTFAGIRGESGYLDGIPLKSKFNWPTGICIGADGAMYVADNGNHLIRKIVVQ